MRYLAIVVMACAAIIWFFVSSSESSSTNAVSRPNNSNLLDQPIRIRLNDAPLNSAAKKSFPSPAIFDADGDGSEDLVIGDLMGGVGVYANLNTSGVGDPVWSSRKDLSDATGNPVTTPNW